jgi:hypothetical protein
VDDQLDNQKMQQLLEFSKAIRGSDCNNQFVYIILESQKIGYTTAHVIFLFILFSSPTAIKEAILTNHPPSFIDLHVYNRNQNLAKQWYAKGYLCPRIAQRHILNRAIVKQYYNTLVITIRCLCNDIEESLENYRLRNVIQVSIPMTNFGHVFSYFYHCYFSHTRKMKHEVQGTSSTTAKRKCKPS